MADMSVVLLLLALTPAVFTWVSEPASITATPTVLKGNGGWVDVSWKHIEFSDWTDYIGIYPATIVNDTAIPSPIMFQPAWPGNHTKKYPPHQGSTRFYLINRRIEYIIAYMTGTRPYSSVTAVTKRISFTNLYAPLQPHIVVPPQNPTAVALTWNCKAHNMPKWKIGLESGKYTEVIKANVTTYHKSDMCDPQNFYPASRDGWMDPGFFLTALWQPKVASTKYYYIFGDDKYGYSKEHFFYSPPRLGDRQKTVMIGFGDMGQTPRDGSHQHSWDWDDRGEVPTLNTSRTMMNLVDKALETTNSVYVMHIGDISYAVGYLYEWDQFMDLIAPTASKVPYLTGIGNHEMGWSGSYWGPPSDSGGECGVPYLARFPFISKEFKPPAKQTPWYSVQYGLVTTIVMSTEHDYKKGSEQYAFLKGALEAIDRTVTPWVVFTGHRCMFWNNTYAWEMQDNLEPLMSEHQVDMALWGHSHLYVRTCPMYKFDCKANAQAGGITHFLIGTAGYHLGGYYPGKDWVKKGNKWDYGIGNFEFYNSTTAMVQWINVATGKVMDEVMMSRDDTNDFPRQDKTWRWQNIVPYTPEPPPESPQVEPTPGSSKANVPGPRGVSGQN